MAASTPTKLLFSILDGDSLSVAGAEDATAGGPPAALLPATSVSPRTSQDIKDELKFKVWAAAANGTENCKALPSTAIGTPRQQTRTPPHLRQPLRQLQQPSLPQQHTVPPPAPPQKQEAIQGDGRWNDKKTEDLKKRLALVGVPAANSTAAPPHLRRSAAIPSPAGAAAIPHHDQNAARFSPFTATTAGAVDLQENCKLAVAAASTVVSYQAAECWQSW